MTKAFLILLALVSIGCKGPEQKSPAPQAIETEKSAPAPETQAAPAKVTPSLWKPMKAPPLKGAVSALIEFQGRLMAYVDGQGASYLNGDASAWETVPGLEKKNDVIFKDCGSELFAGTKAFGVYRYLSDKKQWVPMNQGLFQARKGPSPKGDVTGESPPNCEIDECRYNRDVYGLACDATHLYAATERAVYWASLKDKKWKELWGARGDIVNITLLGEDLYIGRAGGADVCGVYKIKSGPTVIKNARQELSCHPIISLISFEQKLFAALYTEIQMRQKDSSNWESTGKEMGYMEFSLCQGKLFAMSSYEDSALPYGLFKFQPEKKSWDLVTEGVKGDGFSSLTLANSPIYGGTHSGKIYQLDCQ